MHFDIYKVQSPTNALFIKLGKVLKFALKITLTWSYTFRSTQHSERYTHRTYDMLPHHRVTYNDLDFYRILTLT